MHENNSIQTSQVKSMETLACIVLFPFFLPVIPSLLPLSFLLWLGGLIINITLKLNNGMLQKNLSFVEFDTRGKMMRKKVTKLLIYIVFTFFFTRLTAQEILI